MIQTSGRPSAVMGDIVSSLYVPVVPLPVVTVSNM